MPVKLSIMMKRRSLVVWSLQREISFIFLLALKQCVTNILTFDLKKTTKSQNMAGQGNSSCKHSWGQKLKKKAK